MAGLVLRKTTHHEKVIRIRRSASDSEQFQEIIELTVNVSDYCHRCRYIWNILISLQDFFSLQMLQSSLSDISMPWLTPHSIKAAASIIQAEGGPYIAISQIVSQQRIII
jgi:hypothetical protein